MYSSSLIKVVGATLFASQTVLANVNGICPHLGAVLPSPKAPSEHPAVKGAIVKLQQFIDDHVSKLKGSAVSVAVKSIHEDKPLLHFHYTPPALDKKGTQKVDAKSIYRLGSISKIFPVLAVLKLDGVSLDDKVTKYLPELRKLADQQTVKDALTVVDWDEITLGALAAHLAGIGRDFALDYSAFPGYIEGAPKFGLPGKDNNITTPGCSGLGPSSPPCSKEHWLARFGMRVPTFAPYSAPGYSNIGTPILALVVEKVSGQTYPDFLKSKVLAPLNLTDTAGVPPKDLSRAVIPVNDTWFGFDLAFQQPAGGWYSTSDNMLAFGDAVLGNKIFTAAQTRKWFKPMTNTASLGTQLGAPWEIFRATNVTKDQRSIEIITKAGDLFNYRTTLGMVPDYDFLWTVLIGGDPKEMGTSVNVIQAAAAKLLIPAFEQASRDEAAREYAGIYHDPASNSTIVLEVDPTDVNPGIKVAEITIRGFDVLNNYPLIGSRDPTAQKPNPMPLVRLRLQPATALSNEVRESWRGIWTVGPPEAVAKQDEPFPWAQNGCLSWAMGDSLVYALKAMDHFIFYRNKLVHTSARGIKSGAAQSIEFPAFQVKLNKLPRNGTK